MVAGRLLRFAVAAVTCFFLCLLYLDYLACPGRRLPVPHLSLLDDFRHLLRFPCLLDLVLGDAARLEDRFRNAVEVPGLELRTGLILDSLEPLRYLQPVREDGPIEQRNQGGDEADCELHANRRDTLDEQRRT